ncbi:MAG: DNA cytosine methyltransferase [Betaproteobacteria bacterium]|nr:DNA cytosine methyltransferase [Betaproteobacteria bacterium]
MFERSHSAEFEPAKNQNIAEQRSSLVSWLTSTSAPDWCDFPKSIRVVDLFSGCGGLTLGVSEAARAAQVGTEVVLACDTNDSALSVYRQNFGKIGDRIVHADLMSAFADPKEFHFSSGVVPYSEFGHIDLLVAGPPPCQGHSDLNNSTRRSDPQ